MVEALSRVPFIWPCRTYGKCILHVNGCTFLLIRRRLCVRAFVCLCACGCSFVCVGSPNVCCVRRPLARGWRCCLPDCSCADWPSKPQAFAWGALASPLASCAFSCACVRLVVDIHTRTLWRGLYIYIYAYSAHRLFGYLFLVWRVAYRFNLVIEIEGSSC